MANVVIRRLFLTKNAVKITSVRCASIYRGSIVLTHNKPNRDNPIVYIQPYKIFEQHPHRTLSIRDYSSASAPKKSSDDDDAPKLTLFQRFKQMYKEYWYVLLPVHLVTSAVWFGSFYYMAKSGVDVVALLETMHVSERIVNSLRDSSMGYIAIAYALYKVTTPLRYTVTLGGTTVSINYLRKWGYIKPVPSRERLKELYKVRKDNIMGTVRDFEDSIKHIKSTGGDDVGKKAATAAAEHLKNNIKKNLKKD